MFKAVGAAAVAAFICSYLSLCLLYRIGQWQIVLHPDPSARTKPAPAGMVRFGPDETGRPQLTGELLRADPGLRYSKITVLFLGGGDGSRLNASATVNALRELQLSVLWFDYRGYGHSGEIHPNQQRMSEDAASAWRYLTGTHQVLPQQIVLYGTGVGASLATRLAADHPDVAALILDAPYTDLLDAARQDYRSKLVPAGLLFRERFPLATPLSTLTTPKLLIYSDREPEPAAYATAATPKLTTSLPAASGPLFNETLTRFLDQYVTAPASAIVPSTAPAGTIQH
ncbi:MAG: alpha/beta fold hydrolase [Acidobacteria bacterium]|nr:alpha/beta fold hydrolase [Acidobacteriota bacterium]